MNRVSRALVALSVCAGFAAVGSVHAQQASQREPLKPILAGKFVPPVNGVAEVQFTPPKTVAKGKQVVTTFQVKNVSNAPIAGFKVSETWYDKQRALMAGVGETYVHKRLFQPGEIITITLTDERDPRMDTNPMVFSHANGTIPKPKKVTKF